MQKITKAFLLAAIILCTQTAAQAIIFLERSGVYISGSGSIDWNIPYKTALTVAPTPPPVIPGITTTGKTRPNTSFNGNLALGYYLDQWRLEIEGNYRHKKEKPILSNSGVTVTDFGYLSEFSAMANVYYDIPLIPCWGFYLGAGLGAAFSEIELTGAINVSEEDTRFAAQLMAGTFYHVNRCVALTLGYRLFTTTSPEDFSFTNGAVTGSISAESSPIVQSIELGIRINL